MMRDHFDRQLRLLNREMTEMGALCEEAISLAAKALAQGDRELAAGVSPLEEEIDQRERKIEGLCLKLLLQQQPVASDLRQISAALKIITDMERIGDQAEDIAEIILAMLAEGCRPEDVGHIREMAALTSRMVNHSVDAYVRRDAGAADQVIRRDGEIDSRFMTVRRELIRRIAAAPGEGEHFLDLLMIGKYLERIGDHAVNIAERVIGSACSREEH